MAKFVRWVLSLALVLGFALATQPAFAADRSDMVNSIKITNESSDPADQLVQWNEAKISVDFSSKGGVRVKAGDNFTLKLPAEFAAYTGAFPMEAEDGTKLGDCAVDGGMTMVCTFNAEAARRTYIEGDAWFRVQATKETKSETLPFVKGTGTIEVDLPGTGGIGAPGPLLYPDTLDKWGWFNSPERNEMYWQLLMPAGTIPAGELTLTDKLGAGHTLTPGSIKIESSTGNDADGTWTAVDAAIAPAADGKSFTITVADAKIDRTKYHRVTYNTKPDAGTGTADYEYDNSFQINGKDAASETVTRDSSGQATADGPTPEPSIEIVKKDAAGNDADTVDQSVALADGATDLVFTITNNGEEALKSVVVSDQVTAGNATVSGLSCDFSPLGGPATGVEWADGPFEPGASFTCSAKLAGVQPGVAHADIAKVDGVGIASGKPVSDDNPYNAHTTAVPSIEIVKKDAAGNDADTADHSVLLPNGSTDLVFTITNNGNEPLVEVAVADKVTAGGGKVDMIVCTFPDKSTGTSWAGPFAPAASFTCSAKLTGVAPGTQHTDIASVTGKGQFSGKPVTDDNPYNAKVPAAVPPATPKPPVPPATPVPPVTPVTPAGPKPVVPVKPVLAQTGADVGGLGQIAIALIAAGALAVAGGRRRKA